MNLLDIIYAKRHAAYYCNAGETPLRSLVPGVSAMLPDLPVRASSVGAQLARDRHAPRNEEGRTMKRLLSIVCAVGLAGCAGIGTASHRAEHPDEYVKGTSCYYPMSLWENAKRAPCHQSLIGTSDDWTHIVGRGAGAMPPPIIILPPVQGQPWGQPGGPFYQPQLQLTPPPQIGPKLTCRRFPGTDTFTCD